VQCDAVHSDSPDGDDGDDDHDGVIMMLMCRTRRDITFARLA
jgi:hypothetical protein